MLAVGGVVEEVEGVAAVAAAAVFAGDGVGDVREGFHAFVELGGVIEFDAGGEVLEVGVECAVAGDACGLGDAVVVSGEVCGAWGIVGFSGPEDGHTAVEEVAVLFEVEDGFLAGAPDAEAGFADDGGVLPADAEVDFGVDAIAAVEECPSAAAAEACLFFIGPFAEGDEG